MTTSAAYLHSYIDHPLRDLPLDRKTVEFTSYALTQLCDDQIQDVRALLRHPAARQPRNPKSAWNPLEHILYPPHDDNTAVSAMVSRQLASAVPSEDGRGKATPVYRNILSFSGIDLDSGLSTDMGIDAAAAWITAITGDPRALDNIELAAITGTQRPGDCIVYCFRWYSTGRALTLGGDQSPTPLRPTA